MAVIYGHVKNSSLPRNMLEQIHILSNSNWYLYNIYMYNINILYIYNKYKYIYNIILYIYFYVNIYTLTSQRNCCALFTYKISHSHANIGTNSPAWTIASTRFFRWRGVEFHWGSIAYPCSPIPLYPLYPLYPPMIHILLNHGVWGMGLPQLYSVVLACSCYVSRFLSSFIYLNIPQLSSWFSRVLCPTRFLKLWSPLQTTAAGACMFVFLVEDDPSVWEPKDGQPDQGYVNVYRGVDFLRANTWPRVWWFCDADVGCISGRLHVDMSTSIWFREQVGYHQKGWENRITQMQIDERKYHD